MKIEIEGKSARVIIAYDVNNIARLKAIGGGKWNAGLKSWMFPLEKLSQLEEMQRELSNEIDIEKQGEELRGYLLRKGYSRNTIKSYVGNLERYLEYAKGDISKESIDAYLIYLLEDKNCSHSHVNQFINSLKTYLRIKRSNIIVDESMIVRPKKENKLPKVMSKEEVKGVIDATKNIKHKTILMLAYSCGLRVSELAYLRLEDIDSSRKVVIVKQGKGRKDRITSLSDKMLEQLRIYYLEYKPTKWVFEGADKDEHIHPSKWVGNSYLEIKR